ncbi:MAG: MoaD/ThiS family protein [Cyanobacteria bacterium J06598_1]
MTEHTVRITLKLFAIYQETIGVPEQTLELPVGTTVGDVLSRLITAHPTLAQWQDLTRFGLNLQFVTAAAALKEGDELVLIPPVSGG